MVYRYASYVSHLKQETFCFNETTHDQRLYLFYMMLHLYKRTRRVQKPFFISSDPRFNVLYALISTDCRPQGPEKTPSFVSIIQLSNNIRRPYRCLAEINVQKLSCTAIKTIIDRQQCFDLQSVGQSQADLCNIDQLCLHQKSMFFFHSNKKKSTGIYTTILK